MGIMSTVEYEKIIQKVNPNLEVTSEYLGERTQITYKCKKCGFMDTINERQLRRRRMCPNCEGIRRIIFGVNDLATLRPDIANMMVDKSIVNKIGINSKKQTDFICPTCGEKITSHIVEVTRHGLVCKNCSNTYSYPNKFMYKILKSLNINFTPEFSPMWAEQRRYDFMFELNNVKYIIEMDGIWHIADNLMSGITKEQSQNIDTYKENLAIEHGYYVIRIDCYIHTSYIDERFEYIKSSILKSELCSILDFSDVDWKKCDLYAQKSDFSRICYLYDNVTHDIDKIASMIGVCYETVISNLKHSEKIGCSTYKHTDGLIERNELRKMKVAKSNGMPLLCIETNEIFYSIACAKRVYGGNIDAYLRGKCEYSGTLSDGTRLNWKRITDDEAQELLRTNKYIYRDVDFQPSDTDKLRRKYINVVKCNETNEYFITKSKANQKYRANLGHYFMDNYSYSGKLPDGALLTWSKPSLDEVLSYINNGGIIIS